MDAAPSTTAASTAVVRGLHRLHDDPPWVLDDPFALPLVGPIWRMVARHHAAHYPPAVARAYLGGIVGRARYAEDRLLDGGFDQYVLLGAGLDSFVWRRPDVVRRCTVYEVDHPSSQQAKRERAATVALPEVPGTVYVPMDFEVDRVHDRLVASGFDPRRPALFSWLGVTMYLTLPAIEDTLAAVGAGAAGTEVVLSYAVDDELLDDVGRDFARIAAELTTRVNEPYLTRFCRPEVVALVERAGLEVAEHPTHADWVERYFGDRPDGLRPFTAEGLLVARVPGPPAPGSSGAPTSPSPTYGAG